MFTRSYKIRESEQISGLIRIILRGLFPESQNYGQSKPQL